MDNYKVIEKEIINNTNNDLFINDVILFEINNINELDINLKDIKVFKSARQKNDMPSVFTLNKNDSSLKDCLKVINESGNKLIVKKTNMVISDSLTIIGNTNKSFVISFLGGLKHLIRVEIRLDNNANFINLKVIAEINKIFKANETFKCEKLELYYTNNVNKAIEDYCDKKANDFVIKNKKVPSVYTTWYYYGNKISFNDCLTNLKVIKEKNLPIDTFQIDDGWAKYIGDLKTNKKFPSDLKEISSTIRKYGLTPGIWSAPFIVDKKSDFAKKHKDWILLNNHNKPCVYKVNKHHYYVIDISITDTWKYFENYYHELTFTYGFSYHKLDFTRIPLTIRNHNYKNKNITIIEAYRNSLASIRKGMGSDSFFLLCGGIYDSSIGIVDASRVGSDVMSMWKVNKHKGGKSLPYTIKQCLLRYYMNAWWYNDPDALMIRENNIKYKGLNLSLGLLNNQEVKTATLLQLLTGGLMCLCEPLDKISDVRLNNIYHLLPIKDIKVEIPYLLDIKLYPSIIKITRNDTNYEYLALINYEDDNKTFIVDLSKYIKDYLKISNVIDFYNKENKIDIIDNNSIEITLKAHESTIIRIVKENELVENTNNYLI